MSHKRDGRARQDDLGNRGGLERKSVGKTLRRDERGLRGRLRIMKTPTMSTMMTAT